MGQNLITAAYRNDGTQILDVPEHQALVNSFGVTGVTAKLGAIRRCIEGARAFNPYDAPVAADQPTITGVHDGSKTFTNCDPAAATTAAKMNLLGGRWTKDGANSRWVAVADTASPGTPGGVSTVEFCTDDPAPEVRTSVGTIYAEVDGYAINKAGIAVVGTGQQQAVLDYSGTTGRKPRSYKIMSNTLIYHYSIGVSAASRLWAPKRDSIIKVYWEGDSYIANTYADASAAGTMIPNLGMAGIATMRCGFRDYWNGAEGGTGLTATSNGTKYTYIQRMASIQYANPDLLIIFGSINDNNQSTAVLYNIALAYYQRIRSWFPLLPIIVFGAQAGSTGPSASLLAVEAAISNAVATMVAAGDNLIVFVPVSTETPPFCDSANSTIYLGAFDSTHPNPTIGHDYFGHRLYHGILYAINKMIAYYQM